MLVIDVADNQVIRTIDKSEMFANQTADGETAAVPPFELVLDDGNVWFNSLAGPEAGVLDRTGVTLRVLKYEAAPGGNGKAGNGLGVGDDQAALGVDLDPNLGAARQDGNDDDQASRRDDAGEPAGERGGDGNGSAGSGLSEPLGPDAAGPADRAAAGVAQQPNRFPGSGRGRVGADSRPSTPSNPSSPLAPAAPSPPRPPEPAAGPEAAVFGADRDVPASAPRRHGRWRRDVHRPLNLHSRPTAGSGTSGTAPRPRWPTRPMRTAPPAPTWSR